MQKTLSPGLETGRPGVEKSVFFVPPATRPGPANADYGCVVCNLNLFLTIEGHWRSLEVTGGHWWSLEVKNGKGLFKNHISLPKGGWGEPQM